MTNVRDQGASEPASKSPFLTIGVATEQVDGFVVVTVATTVVTTTIGEGVVERMQEQALLSRDAGYAVVAGRSRLALATVTVVVVVFVVLVVGRM